jgi:beta-phosphoglucomutase-like phosphatase (HAD superfamily)
MEELDLILKSKKMYLFDFDGTLADTETLHWKAYNICLKRFNVVLKEENIKEYIGKQETEIYKMIQSDFDISFNESEFFDERIKYYLGLVESENLQPFPYVLQLLENSNVEFNILSSNRLVVLEAVLEIWGLRNKFNKIISAATNKIKKGDVITNLKEYYNFNKEDVVLFEDSSEYLKIGKSNEITTVGIEHYYNANTLVECDYIWSTL